MISKFRTAWRILKSDGWRGLAAASARRFGLHGRQAPSMLTPQEVAWVSRHMAEEHRGVGAVVDLGCWLGSSTLALAKGLGRNPRAVQRTVHAYDRFVWEAWMDEIAAGTLLEGKFRSGDSFLDEFRRQTRKWRGQIEVHAGDLRELRWAGGPIEFLFVDVMKSWELANRVIQEFFPHLIPGVSILVHQDFVHYYTSWIPLLAYRFRDCFEPVCHVAGSPSVVFRLARPIPAELLRTTWSFAAFSPAEFEAAFTCALALVEPACQAELHLARVMAFIHQGDLDRAEHELAEAQKRGDLSRTWGMARVEAELAKVEGRAARVL